VTAVESLERAPARSSLEAPLCVDLDGALLASDLLWESLAVMVRKRPASIGRMPMWLLRGKAYFKSRVAEHALPDVTLLPYREDVLAYLKRELGEGRRIVLTTGADRRGAEKIAEHLQLFSSIIASDGQSNVTGSRKVAAIRRHTEGGEFDYIGDSRVDRPVWRAARRAMLVEPSRRLLRKAEREASVEHVFPKRHGTLKSALSALRVHQWVKNVLLFVPLVLAHRIGDLDLLVRVGWAFVAFSLCASAVYVANDFLDLEHDRRHPVKRHRPFAAGKLPIASAAVLAPALLLVGVALASLTQPALFVALLALYVVVSNGYSLFLKRIVIVDVMILAGLYTLRVISGGASAGVTLSPWLLAFSLFLFFSLAFAKRYSELELGQGGGEKTPGGRGYRADDLPIIRAIGPASGVTSVLILALYINGEAVATLYRNPAALWPAAPLALFWITRIWFLAHRGVLTDDPIVFTLKDPVSYIVGGAIGLLLVVGTVW